jgi:RND family efflux transporter MFP subunit
MTKRYFIIPFTAVILAACGGGAPKNKEAQLQKLKQERSKIDEQIAALEKEVGKTDTVQKVKTVTIATLDDTTFQHYIDVQGSVDARENVNVTSKVPGVVTAIMVKEGQHVSKGQTLGQVDDQLVRSSIAELKTQLDLATTTYQKQKHLWDQQIGSEMQYLTAKNNMESLQKKLSTLNEQLAQTRIISPINGTVDAVIAKLGDNIGPSSPTAAFRVVNSNALKVVANVAEGYAGNVKTGDPVIINFPDINKEIRTKIGFASRTIDPQSRTIKIEVPLPADAALRPNMIAHVKIVDYTANNAVVIPVNVIQYTMGKPFVVVAKEANGKMLAQRRDIEVGRTYNDIAEIKNGLQAGEKLVTTGYQGLDDNDLIKL